MTPFDSDVLNYRSTSGEFLMSTGPNTGNLSWEEAVIWLRNRPDQRQLVLDAYYDDPLLAAAKRYHDSEEWRGIATLLAGRFGRVLDVAPGAELRATRWPAKDSM
jgi:hypothetical protein